MRSISLQAKDRFLLNESRIFQLRRSKHRPIKSIGLRSICWSALWIRFGEEAYAQYPRPGMGHDGGGHRQDGYLRQP